MTAYDIARAIMSNRWRRSFVLPCYTPRGWWECDVFELTAAGYFREYEIKLSVADFRADAGKKWFGTYRYENGQRVEMPGRKKHDLLAEGSPKGPTRFWFVTPSGLLAPEQVPEWAGLMEAAHRTDRLGAQWISLAEVRPAPQLHREKPGDDRVRHARGVCYWRMHELMNELHCLRRARTEEALPMIGGGGGVTHDPVRHPPLPPP